MVRGDLSLLTLLVQNVRIFGTTSSEQGAFASLSMRLEQLLAKTPPPQYLAEDSYTYKETEGAQATLTYTTHKGTCFW